MARRRYPAPRTWNPRRAQIILAAILVVGVGAVGGGFALRDRGGTDGTDTGTDGGFRFRRVEVRCGFENVVTSDTRLPADGQFCLAQFAATNEGAEETTLDVSCQFLEDRGGERYGADEEATLLDPAGQALFQEGVGPGEDVARGLVIFDIPAEATASSVELHGTCDSEGLSVSV